MNKIKSQELQSEFLASIKSVLGPNLSLADELSDILEVSKDSIYRRLRNETYLGLEEIIKLSEHFNIPFSLHRKQHHEHVSFSYKQLTNQADYKIMLTSIILDMQKIANSENPTMTYVAKEIPVFHYFHFKELSAFKVFYWMKGVLNDPEFTEKKFNIDLIDPEILELTNTLYKYYCKLPSNEVWSQSTINSQIEQVQYYWDSGLFESKEQALLICDQTEKMFERIQEQAGKGTKELSTSDSLNPNYSLYHSELEVGNNTIMIDRSNSKLLYLSFNTLNKMSTTDVQFCNETQKWIDNLTKKSVLISTVSEKLRFQFFNSLYKKLNTLKNHIKEN